MSDYNIIDVIRCRSLHGATFGVMFVNDKFQCYTLEPYFNPDWDNLKSYDFKAQKEVEKNMHKRYLAVPSGIYDLRLDIVSPLYASKSWSKQFNQGKMPRVMCSTHDGILIHPGNYLKDTKGCLLVGNSFTEYGVFDSTQAFKTLYNKLKSFKYPIKIHYQYLSSYVCQSS